MIIFADQITAVSDAQRVIFEYLVTFKDINGLVEQNTQLRSCLRHLGMQADEFEIKEAELKANFQKELQKLSINVELQPLLYDYRQKVRESLDSIRVAEELSRKLSMEMDVVHENFKVEADELKKSLESLQDRVNELEAECKTQMQEAARCRSGLKVESNMSLNRHRESSQRRQTTSCLFFLFR